LNPLLNWTALIGLGGLLAFLPFGIAGQQISAALCLLALLLFRGGRGRLARAVRGEGAGRLLPVAILLWIAALLLSLSLSDQAGTGMRELRKVPLLVAIFLPAGALVGRRELRAAMVWLLSAGGAAAVAGLAEHFRALGLNPDRLDGPINSYMTTSGIFLQLSLVALSLLVRRQWFRGVAPAAFLLLTAALFLTFTRGAWLGWAAGASLLLVRGRMKWLLPAMAVVTTIFLVQPELRERAATIVDPRYPTNARRMVLWEAGWDAFQEEPLTGRGLHNLEPLILERAGPAASGTDSHFHSNLVQTAASMGAVGVVAFVLLMTAFYRSVMFHGRETPDPLARALSEGAGAALTGFLVHGMFEWNMGDSEVITSLYTIIGIAVASAMIISRGAEETPAGRRQ